MRNINDRWVGQAQSRVTGVEFSVSEGDTTALCELSFHTDLAAVGWAGVSCQQLYSAAGAGAASVMVTATNLGSQQTAWTFYTEIGARRSSWARAGEVHITLCVAGDAVYQVGASLSLHPTISRLDRPYLQCVKEM